MISHEGTEKRALITEKLAKEIRNTGFGTNLQTHLELTKPLPKTLISHSAKGMQ